MLLKVIVSLGLVLLILFINYSISLALVQKYYDGLQKELIATNKILSNRIKELENGKRSKKWFWK